MGSFERGIIQSLSRSDKWCMGGAGPVMWAPSFPAALARGGFWDPGQFYRHQIGPLFTMDLLDLGGEPIELSLVKRRWNPAYVIVEYQSPGGIRITERKSVLPTGSLVSELRLECDRALDIDLAAWTVQPEEGALRLLDGCIAIPRRLDALVDGADTVWLALAAGPGGVQPAVVLSESGMAIPDWRHCALWEVRSSMEGEVAAGAGGFWHAGLRMRLSVSGTTSTVATVSMTLAADPVLAAEEARRCVAGGTHVVDESLGTWEEYLAGIPRFDSSSEHLRTYYWYRWSGLRLCTQAPGAGMLNRPVVCEGQGYFRRAITYSAPAHIRETRWMHLPDTAFDELRIFLDAQEHNGRFAGILDVEGPVPESFYHADWGGAVRDLLAVHPDLDLTAHAYDALVRYARWLTEARDRGECGLYTIENHYETGQEYSSRYLAVDPEADCQHWGRRFDLKGVDATVYAYRLYRALEWMGSMLGRTGEAARWCETAHRIRDAILQRMWDPAAAMFHDVNPATGNRTGVDALTCFYPFMTDIPGPEHRRALDHLFDPAKFWTHYPFPSLAFDDAQFDASARWKGRRRNCPWNGRTWPMTNSHIVDAIAHQAWHDPELLPRAAEAFMRALMVLFRGGDAQRPCSFEHYNPMTGAPSLYRGIDDYQHSWVVDLIMKHAAGLQPTVAGDLVIAPLPLKLEFLRVQDARMMGRRVDIELAEGVITDLRVDGEPVPVKGIPARISLAAVGSGITAE
ncbi:hypothetical protein JXA88_06820 [Candidatus Fermentibacteria bacterium]|nr:hypothetical protein [Candidatus Fermentibacteria bacterium]